jgi:small subunit ribosomal protein S6
MSSYESVIVLDPNLTDEQAAKEIETIKERFIKNAGCEVVTIDNWGRRKLAYEINKRREGNYVVYRLSYDKTDAAVSFVEVERYLRFAETVLRFLVVSIPDAMMALPILRPEAFADIIPTYTPRPRPDRSRPPMRPAAGEEAVAPAAAPVEGAPAEVALEIPVVVETPGEVVPPAPAEADSAAGTVTAE